MAEQMDWQMQSGSQRTWLAGLIERFEMVSQSEQRATICEAAVIAACHRYLARPYADIPVPKAKLLN
jgi:hypothetical protein